LLATAHAPLPLRPRGQTAHGPFTHGQGRLKSTLCAGCDFLKGWKSERELFFSAEAFALVDGDGDGDLEDDECDAAAPVLPTCEAEPAKLWLLDELADELDPPEPLCEPPELDPPPPEECWARRATETNRMAGTTKPESRIKHLPTN